MPRYRTLDPDRIIDTLQKLEQRIPDRFPGSGLLQVCGELLQAARESKPRIAAIAAPNHRLRAISITTITVGLLLLTYISTVIEVKRDADNLYDVLQGLTAPSTSSS